MLYIDNHPFKTKHELFLNDVVILNMKNLRLNESMTPADCVEFFLGWFCHIKQPVESVVIRAIIYTIHDSDNEFWYSIKSGGGSSSDRLYHSSVECLVMDRAGNDKRVPILAKYSKNFANVLIYSDEIKRYIADNMTSGEIEIENISEMRQMPSAIIHAMIKNPDFQLPTNLISKIRKYKSVFFDVLNSIASGLETDLVDFGDIDSYKLKYVVFEADTDDVLQEKITKISDRIRMKIDIITKIRKML